MQNHACLPQLMEEFSVPDRFSQACPAQSRLRILGRPRLTMTGYSKELSFRVSKPNFDPCPDISCFVLFYLCPCNKLLLHHTFTTGTCSCSEESTLVVMVWL